MGVIPQADGLMMPRISTNKATSLVSVNYSCDNYSHESMLPRRRELCHP